MGVIAIKAVLLNGPSDLSYQEVPDPICPTDGVVIRVLACGICGSDLRTYEGGSSNKIYPSIIGHEIVGEIVESNNNEFQMGTHLAIAPMVPCGDCWCCNSGFSNLCENMKEIGLATGIPGGFAQYMSLTGEILNKGCINVLKEGSNYENAVLIETASSVLGSHINTNMGNEDLVLVIGSGAIGCLHSEIAKLKGAKEVMIVELSQDKVNLSKQQGFEGIYCFNSGDEELKRLVDEKTNGKGADVVITACPSGQAQADALNLVRKRGKVIFFGGIAKDTQPQLNTNKIHYDEIQIFGASAYSPEINRMAFELVTSGKIDAEKYITHRYGLQDLNFAFKEMKQGKMIKGIILP